MTVGLRRVRGWLSSRPFIPFEAMATPDDATVASRIGLPVRPFLYTLDQIATLLVMESPGLERMIFFEGRTPGARPINKMVARNIALPADRPEWRVAERELIRWLRVKGFRFYERGWAKA